ncbi:Acyl carrier protein 1, mitochondrial [Ancistrocladus abbreviatus]
MAGLVRRVILEHMRVPVVQGISLINGSKKQLLNPISSRWMSSHDDHLTEEEVIERVLSVVKDFPKVDPSKVTPDVHFQKDLGLDSLDNVELVMALEEEFKLEIPDLEADKIDSTKLAIEYIYNHPMAG